MVWTKLLLSKIYPPCQVLWLLLPISQNLSEWLSDWLFSSSQRNNNYCTVKVNGILICALDYETRDFDNHFARLLMNFWRSAVDLIFLAGNVFQAERQYDNVQLATVFQAQLRQSLNNLIPFLNILLVGIFSAVNVGKLCILGSVCCSSVDKKMNDVIPKNACY